MHSFLFVKEIVREFMYLINSGWAELMTKRLEGAEQLEPLPLADGSSCFLLGLTHELVLVYNDLLKSSRHREDPHSLRRLTCTLSALAEAQGDAAACNYWRYRQAQLNYFFPVLMLANPLI